jgi:hypothetical protein
MFRTIYRDRNNWFRNPFAKSKKPIRENPPRFLQWTNPTANDPSQIIGQHQQRSNNVSVVMPTSLPVQRWERLLTTRADHTGHDVIVLSIGTLMRLLTHFHDFIVNQQPDTNNIALLLSASCTDGDTDGLAQRGVDHPSWVRYAEGAGEGAVSVYHPPAHRVITRMIGSIFSPNGNGADQEQALRKLQTDPLTVPGLRRFARDAIRAFKDYDPLRPSLITIRGGGGTDPIHQCGVDFLLSQLPANLHYELFLVPTAREPLHRPNMRGTLASTLLHEAEIQKHIPTIYCLFQQTKSGAHETDIVLASGLITLSGNSRSSDRGELDSTNKFNLIRKIAGNWLLVEPRIVEIPLKPIGEVVKRNGVLEEQLYGALLPDSYGGKRLRAVLDEIFSLVMDDPAAPHFITIATTLDQEEMAYLVSGVEQFLLEEGGDVHVMINPCFPVVSPLTDSAQALICDFRGGQGVRSFLKEFLQEQDREPQTNGITWEELRRIASHVPERERTERIYRDLAHIAQKNQLALPQPKYGKEM